MPMRETKAPATDKGRATRERILQAAAELVAEKGAAGVSLDDVRARTGASRSQLYHYFEDRDDLVRHGHRRHDQRGHRRPGRPAQAPRFLDRNRPVVRRPRRAAGRPASTWRLPDWLARRPARGTGLRRPGGTRRGPRSLGNPSPGWTCPDESAREASVTTPTRQRSPPRRWPASRAASCSPRCAATRASSALPSTQRARTSASVPAPDRIRKDTPDERAIRRRDSRSIPRDATRRRDRISPMERRAAGITSTTSRTLDQGSQSSLPRSSGPRAS